MDLTAIRELVKGGQDVNALDDIGRAPLHYACAIGSRPVVELLLQRGSFKDVEVADKQGYRPIHLAAEGGYSGVMKELIKNGDADPNIAGPDGYSPLHFVCIHGHSVACLTALLSVGESLDLFEKDMYGRTPEEILKEIQGRGKRKTETQKAIRKDRRDPWRKLTREFMYEKKRRKDALYLRKQEMQEKQDAKDRADARVRQGAKAQLNNAIALAKAAFARGEVVDFAALGIDSDMEDEINAMMIDQQDAEGGDDDDEEDEYGYDDDEEEEEDDDEDEDGDEEEDGASLENEKDKGNVADDESEAAVRGGGESKKGNGDVDDATESGGDGESDIKFPDDYTVGAQGRAMQMSAMSAVMAGKSDEDAGSPPTSPGKEIDVPLMEGGEAEEGKTAAGGVSAGGKDAGCEDVGGTGAKETPDSVSSSSSSGEGAARQKAESKEAGSNQVAAEGLAAGAAPPVDVNVREGD